METYRVKTNYKLVTSAWMAIFTCLFSLNSHAEKPSYNFISIEHVNRNINDIRLVPYYDTEKKASFNGLALIGSIEINDRWFGELHYLNIKGKQISGTVYTQSADSYGGAPVDATTVSYEAAITDPKYVSTSIYIGYQVRQTKDSSTFIAVGHASDRAELNYQTEYIFRDSLGNVTPSAVWMPHSYSSNASDSGAIISAGYRANLGNQIQLGVRFDSVYFDGASPSITGEILYKFTDVFALKIASETAEEETQLSAGLYFNTN